VPDTQVTWRGLTIGGGGNGFHVAEITGWDDLPDPVDMSQPRVRGHGDHVGDLYSQARIVLVTGTIADRAARDTLAGALLTAGPLTSTVEDLTVDTLGRALTAGARLIRRSLPVGDDYPSGVIPFALQWRCPDPLRYGAPQTAATGLPAAGGGLTYPLAYPLGYGAAGQTGQITLPNAGTADTTIVFTVTGPLPAGFELSAAGRRITYPVAVPAGQTITVDTAAGSVLVEGTSDRRASLTSAGWLTVPAAGSLTVQFTSLGGYDPAATVTATWRAAHW
jgi:hypothetical protein